MDVPAIVTVASQSLGAARDILTTLFEAKVDEQAKLKIQKAQRMLGEVQDALFQLREQNSKLQQERENLRAKLAEAETWQTKADKYELAQTPGDSVVYKYKEQPEHFACPSCFNKREIQILQDGNKEYSGTYHCPGCKMSYQVKIPKRLGPLRVQ
ncbi:MAG TPA: hypothetical protein DEB25_02280 [Desulfobulbaceae bacterium]|nr:hypothetical protein [Desulfobulbaceae bacterium]